MLIQENTSLKVDLKNHHKADVASENGSLHSETTRSQSTGIQNKSKTESSNFRKGGVKSNTSVASNTSSVDEDHLSQKVGALQLKVEESVKTIQAERNSKLTLHKTIEDLSQQLSTYKKKFEEMKDGKQDALKQLSRIQESHRLDLVRINTNLEEELENRSQMERKIHDLREEIERLQEENTCEWGRRERLETEKLQLERENKRLKTSSNEMQTEMERRRKTTAEDRDHELQHAQIELHDLHEELSDLRRQYNKDQKLLEDKQEELAHSRRRAEKHETEVRALRNRVEEIKKQQTNTEDELDSAQNQTRKLSRQVEEKDEELEKLHLQLGQLQTRLRRETPTPSWPKSTFTRSGKDDLIGSDSSSDV
uniref:Coiled-coil domain-containing protein 102A-like n=1 Tax=Phallusia mammillata TaxID=59560 RepID=A0A6F9D979_9ASCI|nr:coiled-coil domain-containing protein 102A-like [Phallusia mammillata]